MRIVLFLLAAMAAYGQSLEISGEKSFGAGLHNHLLASYTSDCPQKQNGQFCGHVLELELLKTQAGYQIITSNRFPLQLARWLTIEPGFVAVTGSKQGMYGAGASLSWLAEPKVKGINLLFQGLAHQYLSPAQVSPGNLSLKAYTLAETQSGLRLSAKWQTGWEVDVINNRLKESVNGPFLSYKRGPATLQVVYYGGNSLSAIGGWRWGK